MNQANQRDFFVAPVSAPGKRRRGRPRKDEVLNRHNSSVPRRHTTVPPGFEGRNGNQNGGYVHRTGGADNVVVGQVVSGIVEAVFDVGLLLTVRVGNSDTAYSGVVFKPGHVVPISAENDVAPDLQMIRRSDVSRPKDDLANHAIVPFDSHQSSMVTGQHLNLERNGSVYSTNGSPSADQVPEVVARAGESSASKGKRVAAQSAPSAGRGGVVPVVLQPVKLNQIPIPNEVPPVATTLAAARLAASKGKKFAVATIQCSPLSNDLAANQQMLSSQPETSHQLLARDLQIDHGILSQPASDVFLEGDAKPGKLPGVPSETWQGEEVNRKHTLQSSEVEKSKLTHKTPTEDCGQVSGAKIEKNPLVIQPLQVIEPGLDKESASTFDHGADNMEGLIQETRRFF